MPPAATRGEKWPPRPPVPNSDMDARVKREFVEAVLAEERRGSPGDEGTNSAAGAGDAAAQGTADRRVIRSRYLAVKSLISDDRHDISNLQSDKFMDIFTEVESLHKLVQKPREQVADAEALLDIAGTLVSSVRSYTNEGVTPSDFITGILEKFGQQNMASTSQQGGAQSVVSWADIGISLPGLFKSASGCSTMLGPMNLEVKPRRVVAPRRRKTDAAKARPEELEETAAEKTDTDKNMLTMFEILRKHRSVKLENLVLNRASFAQTVENIFALSFLVKDGRVEISVNNEGHHMISPRNAPSAALVAEGKVKFSHFVFRYDFRDWKLMCETTPVGDELMPHRTLQNSPASSSQVHNAPSSQSAVSRDHNAPSQTCNVFSSQPESVDNASQSSLPTTPIRKFTRHRGLVVQEQVVADSPDSGDFESNDALKRKTRRLFRD